MANQTFTAGGTIAQYSLVYPNGSTSDSVVVAVANSAPIGVAMNAASSGEAVNVEMLDSGKVYFGLAHEALATVNAVIYTAAAGRIQDKTTATMFRLGYLRKPASAQDDVIEWIYQPNAPASVST